MTLSRTPSRALAALAFVAALAALPVSAVVGPQTKQRPLFVAGELIVNWRAGASVVERDAQMVRLGALSGGRVGRGGAQLLRLGRDADLRSAIARLRASGLVESATRVSLKRELEACSAIVAPKLCPNDPDFTADHQYGLHNEFNDADMDLPEAWVVVNNANGVLVAIADDGFNLTHEDLAPDLRSGTNCENDPCVGTAASQNANAESHGSIVAGSAAGRGNNALGIASPVLNGDVLPIRLGESFTDPALVRAYEFATTNDADILNLSLGGPVFTQAESDALDPSTTTGMLIVASAGNDDSSIDKSVDHYPANYDLPNVIAIAASNDRDRIAPFSIWGPTRVDLAAPGTSIRSAWTGGNSNYTYANGTSFSAPYTAGVAALVGQRLIDLGYTAFDYRELKALLFAGADHANDAGDLELRGRVAAGRVNAARTVAKASDLVAGTLGGVLVVDSVVVDDPVGIAAANDDDDQPDAGETVDLIVTLSNAWQSAGAVAGTLTSNSVLDATVVDGSDTSTAIGAFGLGSLTFRVTLNNTVNTQALFRLDLTPQNGAPQTRFFYLEYSPDLANGVELTQALGRTDWDEFHAWNVDVPAGATNVVFETETDGGLDIDLLARRNETPRYLITLAVDPDSGSQIFWAGEEDTNPAYVSGAADGNERLGEPGAPGGDIAGAEDGTWHLVVVNYAQVFLDYRIKASWDAAGAGTIRFNAESASVNESAGTITLSVVRSGGVGAVSASYASASGTATAGADFTAVSGTLNWAAGDTAAKTITVPLANDGVAESAESFTVALSAPTGGADLGRYQTFTVNIAGSTAPPPPPPSGGGGGGGGGGGASDALGLLMLAALAAARRRRMTR